MPRCYQSKFRLHKNPAILTDGRWYRSPKNTPTTPVPTLLGWRGWRSEADVFPRTHGEWDGPEIWDAGIPPDVIPANRIVGCEDCIRNGMGDDAPTPETPALPNQICVKFLDREIHVGRTLLVSFQVVYDEETAFSYDDVPVTIRRCLGAGRFEGDVVIDGHPATVILFVQSGEGTTTEWRMAICDKPAGPPPAVMVGCCDGIPIRKNMFVDVVLRQRNGGELVNTIEFPNIPITYRDGGYNYWTVANDEPLAVCDLGKIRVRFLCVSPFNYWITTVEVNPNVAADEFTGWQGLNDTGPGIGGHEVTCAPFSLAVSDRLRTYNPSPAGGWTETGAWVWWVQFTIHE